VVGFVERFKSLTEREIWTMLNAFTPLERTRAYRLIFAEGKPEGKAEDLTGSLAGGDWRLVTPGLP
jgi:hypothetical protein